VSRPLTRAGGGI